MRFPASHFAASACRVALLAALSLFAPSARASDYFRHVIFDNSLTTDTYFNSRGSANGPSYLEVRNGRLPVETTTFVTPPNALRLQWESKSDGGWEAEVRVDGFRNRNPELSGRNLYLWLYAPAAIAAGDLPQILLSDAAQGLQVAELPAAFTAPMPLGRYTGDLPAGRWVEARIPLADFSTASIYPFRPEFLADVVFHQGRPDGVRHTLIIDEIRVADDATDEKAPAPPPPQHVRAVGYDRHVVVRWDPVATPALARYVIYRSLDGKAFEPLGIQLAGTERYADFLGKAGVTAQYKVAAEDWRYRSSALSEPAGASTREFSDDELLTMLEEACFLYYWEGADPHSGMTRENIPGDDRIVATGASGMGIIALIVGVDRGFITRAQGVERLTKIVNFLEHAQRYHGAWSHYMDGSTGKTMAVFGMFDNGGDLVETSFLMEGLLAARQYFYGPSAAEHDLSSESPGSGRRWNGTGTARLRAGGIPLLALVAASGHGRFIIRSIGFNEVMITYLLGDRIADSRGPGDDVLLRLGRPGSARARVSRGLVRQRRTATTTATGISITASSSMWASARAARCSSLTIRSSGFDPHSLHDRFTTSYFENNRNSRSSTARIASPTQNTSRDMAPMPGD